jgi:hypothetical protein
VGSRKDGAGALLAALAVMLLGYIGVFFGGCCRQPYHGIANAWPMRPRCNYANPTGCPARCSRSRAPTPVRAS